MQVEHRAALRVISNVELSEKDESEIHWGKVLLSSSAPSASKEKTLQRGRIKKVPNPQTFEEIKKLLPQNPANNILLNIFDHLEVHQKQAILAISAKDMPSFYRYLSVCADSLKENEEHLENVRINIKTLLYLGKRWPSLWNDYFKNLTQKKRTEWIQTLSEEEPDFTKMLTFLKKKSPKVYEDLPEDWYEASSDSLFYDQIQECLEERSAIVQEIMEWFLGLEQVDSSVTTQEEFPIHLLESDYRPTFKIWINLLSNVYFNADDLLIQRFLRVTKGNRELTAGVTSLLRHVPNENIWEGILIIGETAKFLPSLQMLLTKKFYLSSPKALSRLFSLDNERLTQFFSLFSLTKESLPLLSFTSQLRGEYGRSLLAWLHENPHLSRYVIGLMRRTVRNKDFFDFGFQRCMTWQKKSPEKADQILSVAFRYPDALEYLISQDLKDTPSLISTTTILNLFDPKEHLTACTHIFRLLEAKENIPMVKVILILGRENKKYASNLLDLAVAGHLDLTTKILSRCKDRKMAQDILTPLLLTVGNSENVVQLKQIFALIENPPEQKISALLLKLIRNHFQETGGLSKKLSLALAAYLRGCDHSVKFFLYMNGKPVTDPGKQFFVTCFDCGNFELVEKCLLNPLHKIFNLYDVEKLEALFAVQDHLRNQKFRVEHIDYISKFLFVTLSDSPSHFGKALHLCFQEPMALMQIVFSENRKEKLDQAVPLEKWKKLFEELFENNENRKATVLTSDQVAHILLHRGIYNQWLAKEIRDMVEEWLPPDAFSYMSEKMDELMEKHSLRNILYSIPPKRAVAVLSALFCPVRQGTYDACFSTSLLMKIQKDTEQFLLCAKELQGGKLKRTQNQVIKEFHLRVPPRGQFDNSNFLQTMELTIAQMSGSYIKQEGWNWLQRYFNGFRVHNDPIYQNKWRLH